ncbi:hypothetical protein QBC47DRAFT_410836 [Echria macrotheca]|uniref:Uncharacterized protein n=1 Tax=Echria macrotheca TaxID=438768 RepID=A0AAJ0BJQ0_9PEZI|nr:hypothetical protein QBC47DRAFT_410836 [Echria macrotheca]
MDHQHQDLYPHLPFHDQPQSFHAYVSPPCDGGMDGEDARMRDDVFEPEWMRDEAGGSVPNEATLMRAFRAPTDPAVQWQQAPMPPNQGLHPVAYPPSANNYMPQRAGPMPRPTTSTSYLPSTMPYRPSPRLSNGPKINGQDALLIRLRQEGLTHPQIAQQFKKAFGKPITPNALAKRFMRIKEVYTEPYRKAIEKIAPEILDLLRRKALSEGETLEVEGKQMKEFERILCNFVQSQIQQKHSL